MNTNEKLERNLKLINLQNIFLEPFFWGPIMVLTLQKLAGMSLAEVYWCEAVIVVFCLLIDVPTGALSDIIGRKKMLVIAKIFLFLSFLGFVFMSCPWHAWLANFLWAIGAAFKSGTDRAITIETCNALEKPPGFYREFIQRAQGHRLLIMALCAPITTWLALIDLRLPLYLSVPTMIIPLVCSFLITEPPNEIEELTLATHVKQMKTGFKDVYSDKKILWIIGYLCLVCLGSKIWFFSYNPYFEYVGLKIEEFGIIFMLLNLVAWVSSRCCILIERRIGEKATFAGLVPMIGLPILLMGMFPLPVMAYLVVFQNIVRGGSGQFIDGFTQQFLTNKTRATILSIQSSIVGAASSIGLWMHGLILGYTDIPTSFIILGSAIIGGHLFLMRLWSKIFGGIH